MVINKHYYSFGAEMPGRTFISATGYRYGFNGKESDSEIKGSGNSYDFGARIYDPRIGRWLAIDPLFHKYPMDAPYIFAGNSPLNVIDPDGEEKIVVAASDQYNNTWKFLNSSLRQLRQYSKSDDTRTLMLLNNGNFYSKSVIKAMGTVGKAFGFNVVVVANTEEMVGYMNGVTTNAHGLKRSDDLITSVDIFAHGTPSQIHSDYHAEGNTVLDKSLAQELKPESFEKGAYFSSYACRTGASIDLPKAWNPIVDDDDIDNQIEINGSNASLAQSLANNLDITVNAFMARSEYSDISGEVLFRKLGGDEAFKGIKGVDGKHGTLYLKGAPFKVTGATETGKVNSGMFKFTKGNKPELTK